MITTIIPTYKRPHFLKRSIQSVLNQTFSDFQIKIYDNASDDETEELVREIAKQDSRVHYFKHPCAIPAAANFQFGLSRVETPFFSILADDDVILPNFYANAFKKLSEYPQADFFLGSVINIQENGAIISAIALEWPEQEYYEPSEGLSRVILQPVNWIGALFRKARLQPINLAVKAIDFDYLVRLAARSSFVFSKEPCGLFIQHPHSYSGHCGAKLVWPGWQITEQTIASHPDIASSLKIAAKKLLPRSFHSTLFRIAITSLFKKQFFQLDLILSIYQNEYPSMVFRRALFQILRFFLQIPLFFYFFYTLYRSLLFFKRFPIQKKYGHLAKHLML